MVPADILNSVADGITKFQRLFSKNGIDAVLVLGDRYEIIAPVIAARFLNLIVIHLHQGEITNGAFDDWIGHSVSKMSNLHFTANDVYRDRLIRMGEKPDTVFTIGSIALEHIDRPDKFEDSSVQNFVNRYRGDFVLLTFHPETNNSAPILDQIKSLKSLSSEKSKRAFLITRPILILEALK